MIERIGQEQLLAMLLAGTPDHIVEASALVMPDDMADLGAARDALADFALVAEPVEPPPGLRERLLAARPRPRRPVRPVLVVLDMLNDHLTPGRPLEVPRAREIVPALQRRLLASRAEGIPVVYACDHHRAGDPDLRFLPDHALEGTPGADVWPDLAPVPGDVMVRKPTYSAFTRSDLGDRLAELGADRIILTGCATEVGLQATAVDALQRGYVVTVPPDCQAGFSVLAEQLTMLVLSTMLPYDPIYLRGERGARGPVPPT
jgi:nicotinamidase-related amidase